MSTRIGQVNVAHRYYFAVRNGDGSPRTGLLIGDFDIDVRNPQNTATESVAAVTEVANGLYFFDISAAFSNTHGAGQYGVVVEVTTAPLDTKAGSVFFSANLLDDLAAPGDAMDLVAGAVDAAAVATGAIDADALAADAVAEIADGVLDEPMAGHDTAGTLGRLLNRQELVIYYDGEAGADGIGSFGDPFNAEASVLAAMTGSDAARICEIHDKVSYFIPPAGDWTNKHFRAAQGSVAGIQPDERDFNASRFELLSFQQLGGGGFGPFGAGFGGLSFEKCFLLGPLDVPAAQFFECGFAMLPAGPLFLEGQGDFVFADCYNYRPESLGQSLVVDFSKSAAPGARALFHRWSGTITVQNMASAADTLEIDGRFDLVVDSTNTAGTIRVRGEGGTLTVDPAATVTIDDTRFDSGARVRMVVAEASSGNLGITMWLERYGAPVLLPTAASIVITDQDDVVIATDSSAAGPDIAADGAYVFDLAPAPGLVPGDTMTARMVITDPIGTVTTIEGIGAN